MQADGDFCVAFNVLLGLAVVVLIFVVLGLVISRRRLKRQVARLVQRLNVRRVNKPANPVTTHRNGGTRVTPPDQGISLGNRSIRVGNTGTYDEVSYFTNPENVHVLNPEDYLNVTYGYTDDTAGYMLDIEGVCRISQENTDIPSGCCGRDGKVTRSHSDKTSEALAHVSKEKLSTKDDSTLTTVDSTPKASTREESDVALNEPQHTIHTDANIAVTTYNRLADCDELEHVYREIN